MKYLLLIFTFTAISGSMNPPPPINEMAMFENMMKNHYSKIFPNRNRNSGGPMFFKYIYQNLANSHEEFIAYNKFYCGVSGSIIMPNRPKRYTTVKIRDNKNKCVKGNYYRCCWPCSGDIMKYSRVEEVNLKIPREMYSEEKKYKVLTINDPCKSCIDDICTNFPKEVGAFNCKDGLTKNGLRIKGNRITEEMGDLFCSFSRS